MILRSWWRMEIKIMMEKLIMMVREKTKITSLQCLHLRTLWLYVSKSLTLYLLSDRVPGIHERCWIKGLSGRPTTAASSLIIDCNIIRGHSWRYPCTTISTKPTVWLEIFFTATYWHFSFIVHQISLFCHFLRQRNLLDANIHVRWMPLDRSQTPLSCMCAATL